MSDIHRLKKLILICIIALFCILPVSDVKAASSKEVVKVGYFDDDTFHAGQSDDAIKRGYGYEYYNMISNYTGWRYEYYYGSWSTVYDAFLRGEIDILDNMSITAERREVMDFSTLPMGEEHYYIFVPEKDESIIITDIKSLNGKRIGVEANSINQDLLENFIKDAGLDCQVVPCLGIKDIMARIEKGKLDAMVNTDAFSMDGYRASFVLGNSNFYFAVRKDRPDLLEQLNYAMNHIHESNPNYNSQLANKYLKKSIIRTSLSTEEYQYLAEHQNIKIGYRRDSMPFADQDKETGEMTGLIKDVCNRFNRTLHVNFTAVAFDNNDDMIAAMQNGEIDCAYPVMDNVWLSEQMGYTQTNPISTEQMALVYKGNYRGKGGYQKIGYTIGYPAQVEYILVNQIDTEPVGYKSVKDTVDALQRGDIDGILMNAIGWNFYCRNNPGCDGLYSVSLDESVGFGIAVPKDEVYLFSSLNAAISKLDSGMIVESLNRYAQVRGDYSLKNFILYNKVTVILIFIILCLMLILLFIYYDQNKVQKAKLYYDANHDSLTGVYNRSMLGNIEKKINSNVCLAIVDIDDFKTYNDTHGHEYGDIVIKQVADVLKEEIRTTDILVRFGGDEFLVIMNGMTKAGISIVERRFDAIRDRLQKVEGNYPAVTLSIGIAFSDDGYGQELFDRADAALYEAKEAGKNQYKICEK